MVDIRQTDTGRARTLAIVVAGVGCDDALAYSGGVAFCTGNVPTQGTGGYYWIRSVISAPDSVGVSVDPYLCTMSASVFDFSIVHSTTTAPMLLDPQPRTKISLVSNISAAATTLFTTGTGSTSLAGTVAYLGDEAILMGTHAGSGQYNNCTRGYWSTTAQKHIAGDFCYTRNPHLKHRNAFLIEYDEGGSATIADRGYLTQTPGTSRDGSTISVACNSIANLFTGGMINVGAPAESISGTYSPDESGRIGPQLIATFPFSDRVTGDTTAESYVWFEVDGTICLATSTDELAEVFFPGTGRVLFGDAPPLEVDGDGDQAFPPISVGDVHQLFVVVQSFLGSPQLLSSSFELGSDEYRHPAALIYAFCQSGFSGSVSGYDAWGGDWGIGLSADLFNDTAIQALIAATPDLLIDQLVLGWGAEAVSIESLLCEKLGRPYGLFFGQDEDGKINLIQLGPLSIDLFAAAPVIDILPGTLERIGNAENGYNSIVAEVGGLPWNDPDRISLSSRDGVLRDGPRRAFLSRKRSLTYDLSTRRKGQNEALLQSDLINKIAAGMDDVDRVRVEVLEGAITGVDLSVGAFVRLNSLDLGRDWWIKGGVPISIDSDDPTFTGMIVGRDKRYSTGVVELELLMLASKTGAVVRWRAPSARVKQYIEIGGGISTLELQTNIFHDSGADVDRFEVGDLIDIYRPNGEEVTSDQLIITAIVGSVLDLSGTFSTAPTGGSDIVRLATYSGYGVGGEPITGGGRAYVFAADYATDTLDGGIAADIYG